MTKYIGRILNLGIGRETTRGVGVNPTYWLPRTTFSFDDKIVQARSESGMGVIEDSEEAFVTTKYGQGDIEGEIREDSFGLLLYQMLGSLSTSGPTDSAYTHAFSILQSAQHPSLTFKVQDPNTNEMYKLCMLDSLEITAELDQVVMYKATFMGKQATGTTASTVTYTSADKFTKKHVAVRFAENIAGLSSATALGVKRLRLTISKNVTMDDALGTAEPEDFLNRQFSVEGEVELNYEDETFKDYFKNGTYRSLEIKLQNTDALIGASTRPSLTIQMPKVDFFDWAPDYALDEIVKQTISFRGNRDVANNLAMISTCSLVNEVVSY